MVYGPITASRALSTANLTIRGEKTGDVFRVACGDLDGDAKADLIVTGVVRTSILYNDGVFPADLSTVDLRIGIGWDTRIVGDVNGDGRLDFANYDPFYAQDDAFGDYSGRVLLWYGDHITGTLGADSADATIYGIPGDFLGDGGTVGDLNGDGYSEFGVGGTGYSLGSNLGAVFVWAGGGL